MKQGNRTNKHNETGKKLQQKPAIVTVATSPTGTLYPGALKKLGTNQSKKEAENKKPEWMQVIHLFTIDVKFLQNQLLKCLAFKGRHKGLSFFLEFFQYHDLNKREQGESYFLTSKL